MGIRIIFEYSDSLIKKGSGTVRSKTSSSLDDSSGTVHSFFSNGTVRSKMVGQFAQNHFSGRFTHFVSNIHF